MLFLSTFTNKIDKKGRVSVPAQYRAVLGDQDFSGIIAYASFINPCIEACGYRRIQKLSANIETLEPFSEERDAFATAILGGCVQISFDGEGRVMIPEALLKKAGIKDQELFVGKGETFEIWEPKAFEEYAARAQALAREKRLKLKNESQHGE